MKNLKKVLIFTILIFAIITLYSVVNAATYGFNASPKEIEVGDTVTVDVSVTAGDWVLSLSGAINESWGSNNGELTGNQTQNKRYTFTPDTAGTYTITLSGTITDYDTEETTKVNQTETIVVKEKPPVTDQDQDQDQPTNPEPEQPTEPEVTITDMNVTMYTTSNLNVRASYSTQSERIGYLNKDDSVTVIGKSSNGWYKVRLSNGIEGFVSGEYLTTEKPNTNKSSTATLANLTVTPGSLNETFSREKLSYTMTVESDVESINVNAIPTDSKAKVTVTGNTGLIAGTGNEIKIKVLAEDEISTKTYTIKVTKLATEEENPNIIDEPTEAVLGLSSLSIEGLKLTPNFSTNIYEYKATLTDKTIEKLKINATSSLEDAKIEIIGADNIKDGENVITIIVTSADGEETVTYQIIVNKTEETVAKLNTTQNNNSNQGIIIALIVFIVILVAILVYIIIKKKQNSKPVRIYEDGDYNEDDEGYDDYNSTQNNIEESNNHQNETYEDENYEDDDEDDDWGAPKKKVFGKFRKNGRHF